MESPSSHLRLGVPVTHGELNGRGKVLETSSEPSRKLQPRHIDAFQLNIVSAQRVVPVSPSKPRSKPGKTVEDALPGRSSSYMDKVDRGRSKSPASIASTVSSIPSFIASEISSPSTPSLCSVEYMDHIGSRSGSPASAIPNVALELDGKRSLRSGDASSWRGMGGIAVATEVEPEVAALLALKKRLADRLYGAQLVTRPAESRANVTELLSLRTRLANALREGNCGAGAAERVGANVKEIHQRHLRLAKALCEGNRSSGIAERVASSAGVALAEAASAVVPSLPSPRFLAVVCDGLAYLLPSVAPNMHTADTGRFG